MTIEELSHKEEGLFLKARELYRKEDSPDTIKSLSNIFIAYNEVHRAYAALSAYNIEALKRALFIQWFALSEPNYLTGISDLNEDIEAKVLENLSNLIETGNIDYELTWMLNYYASWDWIFDRIKSFKGFDKSVVNEQNNHLPETINREEMKERGQMGRYWNSLTRFNPGE